MLTLSWITLIVIIGVIFFPFLFKRDRPAVLNSFVVGDRSFGAFMVNCGLSATFIGGAAILNLGTLAYTYGWYALADIIPTSGALILAALFFVKPIRQSKQVSIGAYLAAGNEPYIRQVVGLLGVVLYTLIFAAQVVAVTSLLASYFPIPKTLLAILLVAPMAVYVLRMGYFAVTISDVMQYLMMIAGYLVFVGVGLVVVDVPKVADPISQIKLPFDTVLTLALPLLFVPASQDLYVRIASAKSDKAATIGVLSAALSYFLFGMIAICIGFLAANAGIAMDDPNQVVPIVLHQLFGKWTIIPNLAIFVVIFSTMDSVFFSAVTSFKYDFCGYTDEKKTGLSMGVIVGTIAAIGISIASFKPSILSIILFALTVYVATIFPLALGRRLNVAPRKLRTIALPMILGMIVVELLGIQINYKPFVYAALHFLAILIWRLISKPISTDD